MDLLSEFDSEGGKDGSLLRYDAVNWGFLLGRGSIIDWSSSSSPKLEYSSEDPSLELSESDPWKLLSLYEK